MKTIRVAFSAALGVALAMTPLVAAHADPEECVLINKRTQARICQPLDYYLGKKSSISVWVNNKAKATYTKGKSRTYALHLEYKGFGKKGKCHMRSVNTVKAKGIPSQTMRQPWQTVPCKELAMELFAAKMPFSEVDLKSNLPISVKTRFEVKKPSGKIIKSRWVTLAVKSAYKAP